MKEERQILYWSLLRESTLVYTDWGAFLLKEFKSLDEQIEILESRGLIINDEERAKKYLLTNNYYDIVNGYSKPFMKSKDEYVQGATFDEVSNVYLFERELKNVLFNSILNVEQHVKSSLAYRFEEEHKGQTMAYLDINSYDHTKSKIIAKLITKFHYILETNGRYANNSINHYMNKYGKVPLWVFVNYIDFGTLCYMLEALPRGLQNKIAVDMLSFIKDNNPDAMNPFFYPNELRSFLKNIHEVRNVCAHSSRLLYFKCRSDTVYYQIIHDKYNIRDNSRRRDVYSAFITMECFLTKTEFAILNNTIRKRMKRLNNKIKSISVNEIISLLGFPADWFERQALPQ